jgi:Isochorismatase family
MRLPGDATLIIVTPTNRSEASGDDARTRDLQARIAALQLAWRTAGLPLVHVRQAAAIVASGEPAGAPVAEATLSMSGKDVFLSSGLEDLLTQRGATTIVLCGALGGEAQETPVQQACALGFRTFVVIDAAEGASLGADEPFGATDARDDAIGVDTATALEAVARAAAWRQEKAKR